MQETVCGSERLNRLSVERIGRLDACNHLILVYKYNSGKWEKRRSRLISKKKIFFCGLLISLTLSFTVAYMLG